MDSEKSAKRVGPKEVKPVTKDGVRHEAIHSGKEKGLGENGGFIRAVDGKTGKELWTLEVYRTEYDKEKEEDVQDVFITKISASLFGGKLKIENERGEKFEVDLKTRKVERK